MKPFPYLAIALLPFDWLGGGFQCVFQCGGCRHAG